MRWAIVEVPARNVKVPRRCACCSVLLLGRSPALVIPRAGGNLRFPCCDQCLDHDRVWRSADPVTAVFVAWLAAVAFGIASISVAVMFGAVATFALLAGARRRRCRARLLATRSCACPGVPVRHLGDNGATVELAFASENYATAFARANATAEVHRTERTTA